LLRAEVLADVVGVDLEEQRLAGRLEGTDQDGVGLRGHVAMMTHHATRVRSDGRIGAAGFTDAYAPCEGRDVGPSASGHSCRMET
jgi:hypothetical protein